MDKQEVLRKFKEYEEYLDNCSDEELIERHNSLNINEEDYKHSEDSDY